MNYDVTPKSRENMQNLVGSFGGGQKVKSHSSSGKTLVIWVGVGLTLGGLLWLLLRNKPAGAEPPDPKVKAGPEGMGDIDMDGWVSQLDIDLMKDIMFQRISPTAEEFRRADLNQDGYVDSTDISSAMLIIDGRLPAE